MSGVKLDWIFNGFNINARVHLGQKVWNIQVQVWRQPDSPSLISNSLQLNSLPQASSLPLLGTTVSCTHQECICWQWHTQGSGVNLAMGQCHMDQEGERLAQDVGAITCKHTEAHLELSN